MCSFIHAVRLYSVRNSCSEVTWNSEVSCFHNNWLSLKEIHMPLKLLHTKPSAGVQNLDYFTVHLYWVFHVFLFKVLLFLSWKTVKYLERNLNTISFSSTQYDLILLLWRTWIHMCKVIAFANSFLVFVSSSNRFIFCE